MKQVLLLSLASAALISLSMRPWGLGFLALVAFLPLLAFLVAERRVWRGALASIVMSAGVFVVAFEGAAPAIPWSFPALVVTQALWFAIPGAAFVILQRAYGQWTALCFFPALWVCAEYIPAQPWLWQGATNTLNSIGYSQFATPLMQIAKWSSVMGVSFAIVALNVGLFMLLWRKQVGPMAVVVTIIVLAVALPVVEPESTHRKPLQVALIQGSVPNVDYLLARFDREAQQDILDRYASLTREALAPEPQIDLVLWPEGSLPVRLDATAKNEDVAAALVGMPTALVGGVWREGDHDYNAALMWQDGSLTSVYHKRALVPIAESMLTPGTRLPPVHIRDTPVGILICLDSLFPSFAREAALDGAELLIVLTSDTFAGKTNTPELHLRATAFRAVEAGRSIAFASQGGPSGFISESGHIVARTGLNDLTSLTVEVPSHVGSTPYLQFGNWLGLLSTLSSFFAVATSLQKQEVTQLKFTQRLRRPNVSFHRR